MVLARTAQKKDEKPMDNATEKTTFLQPLLFTYGQLPESYGYKLTSKETEFLRLWEAVLRLVRPKLLSRAAARTGRKPYDPTDILAVRMVMLHWGLPTLSSAIGFLESAGNVRAITGMGRVPSEATVCRRTAELDGLIDFDAALGAAYAEYGAGRTVANLSVDSTVVQACEKPAPKAQAPARPSGPKAAAKARRKRIRTEYERDYGDVSRYVRTLDDRCSRTGKRNSRGDMEWFVGYKAHMAVDDSGVPVSSIVTGARVHDSKAAAPLLRTAGERCRFLYALMDGGYSSAAIADCARRLGAVPIIDFKADRRGRKRPMAPDEAERYRKRTTVERSNGEMKECFLPAKLRSRGFRARFDLRLAVLLLALKRMRLALLAGRAAASGEAA